MRAIICTDFKNQLRKLIWVTENKTGISAGICDRGADPHATYHVDGTYHHKLKHRGETLTLFPSKEVPLESIDPKAQLLGTATFYSENTMGKLPVFAPDERADSIVILSQSIFINIGCASFNSYIFHRKHETDFLKETYNKYENESFMLVAINVFGLEYFQDHKVGMIIYKGRNGPSTQSSGDMPKCAIDE